MKTFRELSIKLRDGSVESFFRLIEDNLSGNWTQDNMELDPTLLALTDNIPKFSCYRYSESENLPEAYLYLTEKDANLLYVSNIVPVEMGQLSYDEYNAIIIDFFENVLKPIKEKIDVEIEITTPYISLDDILSLECSKLFKAFSRSANKSTGSSHPLDQKRWFSFIMCVDRNEEEIDSNLVQNLLIDDGWPEEKAFELSLEFESAMSLLKFYHEAEESHA